MMGECACWVCCPDDEAENEREYGSQPPLRFTRRREVRARKRYNKWRHRPQYMRSIRYEGAEFIARISYEFGGPDWKWFT